MNAWNLKFSKKTTFVLVLTLICIIGFFSILPAADSKEETALSAVEGETPYLPNEINPKTIMRPDLETKRNWIYSHFSSTPAYIDPVLEKSIPPKGSLSLLSYLPYTPSERNQGYCGNCWAWAGLGVMAIAHNVQDGVSDRLSVQHINSCETGVVGKTCCDGGWLQDVVDFYTSVGSVVPWSNTNAHWQDGDAACDTNCGSVAASPNYGITSIEKTRIETQGVGKATAIANIKNVLHQNKAVWFAFFMGLDSEWNDFYDFWDNQTESAIWDFDSTCGSPWTEQGGGHAVLCVGYNDDDADPSKHYWIMVNSWGSSTGRPDGIFRVAMDMNYDCRDGTYNDYNLLFETLNMEYEGGGSGGSTPDIFWQNNSSGSFGVETYNGTTLSAWNHINRYDTSWIIKATADFNGDGNLDILWQNETSGSFGWETYNRTTLLAWNHIGRYAVDWKIRAVGDFNGDGNLDILWQNDASGSFGWETYNGTTLLAWNYINRYTAPWKIKAADDFNGDGNLDILWQNETSGSFGWETYNGTTLLAWNLIGRYDTSWIIKATADFNGDGNLDILWHNDTFGSFGWETYNGTTLLAWNYINRYADDWNIRGVGAFD